MLFKPIYTNNIKPEFYDKIQDNQKFWNNLSDNTEAINILKQHLNKINWELLSCNIEAINILKQNQN